ncbi:MAG: hypothetical protein V3V10_10055 [Planctomycetota bacterium]
MTDSAPESGFMNRVDWLIQFARLLRQIVPTLNLPSTYNTNQSCCISELEALYRHWQPIYGQLAAFKECDAALGSPQCPTN